MSMRDMLNEYCRFISIIMHENTTKCFLRFWKCSHRWSFGVKINFPSVKFTS